MLLRTAGKEYVDRLYTPAEWSVTQPWFSSFPCTFRDRVEVPVSNRAYAESEGLFMDFV